MISLNINKSISITLHSIVKFTVGFTNYVLHFLSITETEQNFQVKVSEKGFISGSSYPAEERRLFYVSQIILITFHAIVSYSRSVLHTSLSLK